MTSSEKRSDAEPAEPVADPYRGVPLGVEAAWWPTLTGAIRRNLTESPPLPDDSRAGSP